MAGKDGLQHVTRTSVPKALYRRKFCTECTHWLAKHIHKEDLYQPVEGYYWLVRQSQKKRYEKALLAQMEQVWLEKKLEPLGELAWHDGKDSFDLVALSYAKNEMNRYGVNMDWKLTREEQQKILTKVIDNLSQWDLTMVDKPLLPHNDS